MNDPKECDHDYRRLWPRNLRGEPGRDEGAGVLAVLCCRCGTSPIRELGLPPQRTDHYVITDMAGNHAHEEWVVAGHRVKGDWPETHRVTAFYQDADEGPSVEFEVVE